LVSHFFFQGCRAMAIWCMFRRLLLVVVAAMAFSGCLTTKNSKAIQDYRSAVNEFDRRLTDGKNYRIVKGELTLQPGKTTLQFGGVLIGANRWLNVESTVEGIRFFEASERMPSGHAVYLIQQNACCLEDAAFRQILFLKPGDNVPATEILAKHFQYKVAASDGPSALLVMDFTNIYSFGGMLAYWREGGQVTSFAQAPATDYAIVMREVAWHERSQLTLAAMYAWYGITVPLDIVTSPFQLLGLLAYGRGMAK